MAFADDRLSRWEDQIEARARDIADELIAAI
jgi:hypothetical protein